MYLKYEFPHRPLSADQREHLECHEDMVYLMLIGAIAGVMVALGAGVIAMTMALAMAKLCTASMKPLIHGHVPLKLLFTIAVGWAIGAIAREKHLDATTADVVFAVVVSLINGGLWHLLALSGRLRPVHFYVASSLPLALLAVSEWALPRWLTGPIALIWVGAIHAYSVEMMLIGKFPSASSAMWATVSLLFSVPFLLMGLQS